MHTEEAIVASQSGSALGRVGRKALVCLSPWMMGCVEKSCLWVPHGKEKALAWRGASPSDTGSLLGVCRRT